MMMDDENDLSGRFQALSDARPSSEFVDRLLGEVLTAADEFDANPADGALEPVVETSDLVSRSDRANRLRWMAVAAGAVVLAGVALLLPRSGRDQLVSTQASSAFDDELSELLEAADDGRADAQRRLRDVLADAGLLRVASVEVDELTRFSLTADGQTLILSETDGVRLVELTSGDSRTVDFVREVETGVDVEPLTVTFGADAVMVVTPGAHAEIGAADRFELVEPDGSSYRLPTPDAAVDHVVRVAGNQIFVSQDDEEQTVNIRGLSVATGGDNTMRISPDGTLVIADQSATFGNAAGIAVWPVSDGAIDLTHPLVTAGVDAARQTAFSPDGSTVAALVDDDVFVFDRASWTIEQTFPVGPAVELTFAGDTSLVVLGPQEATIWDTRDPQASPLRIDATLIANQSPGGVRSIVAAPDVGLLAVASSTTPETIEVWAVAEPAWIAAACDAIAVDGTRGAASAPCG